MNEVRNGVLASTGGGLKKEEEGGKGLRHTFLLHLSFIAVAQES